MFSSRLDGHHDIMTSVFLLQDEEPTKQDQGTSRIQETTTDRSEDLLLYGTNTNKKDYSPTTPGIFV